MRSPIDYMLQRVGGFKIREVARRCVPCYKYVIEPDGQRLGLCMLIDHYKLYRFPYGSQGAVRHVAGGRRNARPAPQGTLLAGRDGEPAAARVPAWNLPLR